MTTKYSAAVMSGKMAENAVPPGNLLCRSGKYTPPSALVANDIVQMVPVPKSAMIVDIIIQCSNFATTSTLDVGYGSTVDQWFDGLNPNGAAFLENFGSCGQADCAGIILTADDTIDVKVLTCGWPTTATIQMHVLYKMTSRGIPDEMWS